MDWENEKLINILKKGGVVVMPTDTIYGIVGRADRVETIERIYSLRHRRPDKPCIILISDIADAHKFGIQFSSQQGAALEKLWTEKPTSIIVDCPEDKWAYLHRGTKTLALRLPQNSALKQLLSQSGPLIAPSANIEGEPPAKNIPEAQKYFGPAVDLYVDAGEITASPSRVVRLEQDGSLSVLRE